MVARPWSSSRLSCGECLLLRCEGNAGNSFPTTQVKDPSSRARGENGAPLDVRGTLALPLEWRRVCGGTSGLSSVESVLVSSGGIQVRFTLEL